MNKYLVEGLDRLIARESAKDKKSLKEGNYDRVMTAVERAEKDAPKVAEPAAKKPTSVKPPLKRKPGESNHDLIMRALGDEEDSKDEKPVTEARHGRESNYDKVMRVIGEEPVRESAKRRPARRKLMEAESLYARAMKGLSADLKKFVTDNNGGEDMFQDYLEEYGNEQEAFEAARQSFVEAINEKMAEEGAETAEEFKKQAELLSKAAQVLEVFEKSAK